MIVISCSHGRHLGIKIAKKLNVSHSDLFVNKFPDNELQVRFQTSVKDKTLVLVQSFYDNVSDCIMEVILAAQTANELGAKKVILAAPYFPYLRQDKRFHSGEAISQRIVGKLIGRYINEILVIDPHLHRVKTLSKVFKIKSKKLTANTLISFYISKKIKNPVVIGPDEESFQWAKSIADLIGSESRILKKKRFSSFHVEVKLNKEIDLKNKSAVIVDDIVSTGHTILETAKILRKLGAKKIYCICVHGLFTSDALPKLKKAEIKTISTNSIPNPASQIDVSSLFINLE